MDQEEELLDIPEFLRREAEKESKPIETKDAKEVETKPNERITEIKNEIVKEKEKLEIVEKEIKELEVKEIETEVKLNQDLQPKSELKGLSYLFVKIIFLTALFMAWTSNNFATSFVAGFLVKLKFKSL